MIQNSTGVRFSRKLEKKIREAIAFRMLATGNMPDFRTTPGTLYALQKRLGREKRDPGLSLRKSPGSMFIW